MKTINNLILIVIIVICFNCKSKIEGGWEIMEIKGEMKDTSLYGRLIIFNEFNNCYFPDEINLNCKYSFADNKLNINSRNSKLNGIYEVQFSNDKSYLKLVKDNNYFLCRNPDVFVKELYKHVE